MYMVYIYVYQDVYVMYNVCIWCKSTSSGTCQIRFMVSKHQGLQILRWGVLLTEHEMYHKINATFLGKILDLLTTIDSKTPSSTT